MSATKIPLDLIKVASPCTAPWEAMSGDEHVRFCGQCAQNVYNLSEMTQTEAETLVADNEGKMCIRFYRRSDGTMLTKDCPVGWRAVKRRMAIIGGAAAAVVAASFSLLTVGVFAASVRGNGNGGFRLVNPIHRVWDALFPVHNEVMGGMEAPLIAPPVPNQVAMGEMCPPQPNQVPPAAIDFPQPAKIALPAVPLVEKK